MVQLSVNCLLSLTVWAQSESPLQSHLFSLCYEKHCENIIQNECTCIMNQFVVVVDESRYLVTDRFQLVTFLGLGLKHKDSNQFASRFGIYILLKGQRKLL